jgi:hypothetical protein
VDGNYSDRSRSQRREVSPPSGTEGVAIYAPNTLLVVKPISSRLPVVALLGWVWGPVKPVLRARVIQPLGFLLSSLPVPHLLSAPR